jgi:hypothetical protein
MKYETPDTSDQTIHVGLYQVSIGSSLNGPLLSASLDPPEKKNRRVLVEVARDGTIQSHRDQATAHPAKRGRKSLLVSTIRHRPGCDCLSFNLRKPQQRVYHVTRVSIVVYVVNSRSELECHIASRIEHLSGE